VKTGKLYVIPKKPFDGKMKKILFLLSFFGTYLVAAIIFFTTFIQCFFINFLKWTPLLLLIPALTVELILLYVNNDARVKYKRYFMELNLIWNKVDETNTGLSMLLQFILVMGFATITILLMSEFFYFLLGLLSINLLLDYVTVAQRAQCIHMRCPNLINTQTCLRCRQTDGKEPCPFELES
jgi:hypothetical protein